MVDSPDSDPVIFTGDVAGVRDGRSVVHPCPPPAIHVESWQASQLLRDLPVQSMHLTHFGLVDNKATLIEPDLTQLGFLDDHNTWQMSFRRKLFIPKFEAYVQAQLQTRGLDAALTLARYEAANPAYMSVAGLMRYWKESSAS
ncbi:MAG: hypothetical protein R2792_03435 [Saprospiraceae bacterium]